MFTEKQASGYKAYLLRLWRGSEGWRASLQDAHTGEQHNFASFEHLVDYLRSQITDLGARGEVWSSKS